METFSQLANEAIALIRDNRQWAMPVIFVISFAESLALVSFLVPATAIMLAVGALIGGGGLEFWPTWITAVVGAILGDWVSYAIGRHFRDRIGGVWPLSRDPTLLSRAHAFMQRWGALGVFFGRFLGPLRATVPLAAGICDMPQARFQAVNVASAIAWATAMFVPGAMGARWALGALN